jgi:uncharacterized protein involved in exopolysaccharide biosynthesis
MSKTIMGSTLRDVGAYSLEDTQPGKPREISLVAIAITLWKRKWVVLAVTAALIVGSVILALVLPPGWVARTTVMPIAPDQNSILSQYAGLAAAAGIALPTGNTATPTQKIIAILNSRTLCEQVVKDLNLVPVIVPHPERIKDRDPFNVVVEQLQKNCLAIGEDMNTGMITIAVTLTDPAVSQTVANHIVDVLQTMLNEKSLTVSKASIRALEQQMSEQAKKVGDLEARMARFQKDTKVISPEGQVTSAMMLYAGLLEQKMSLEVNLSRLESALSPGNSQIATVQAQLNAVDEQIKKIESGPGVGSLSMENAPEQIVKYENIYRDLKIATTIYSGLLATYENEKLQEAQDQLFVEVIDPAIRPEIREKPKRTLIVLVGAAAGFALGILAALGVDSVRSLRDQFRGA